MRTIVATLTPLMLMLLLAVPAAAHSNQQDGTVTKTFQLTLNGNVPAGDAFFVQYWTQANPENRQIVPFCGALRTEVPRQPACTGGGTIYTQSVDFPQGTVLTFTFYRAPDGYPLGDAFHQGTETLNSDMTNSAYFTFGAAAPGTGQQPPAQLPDTGVSNLTEGELIGSIAMIGIILLLIGGYSVLRRTREHI